MRNTLLLLWFSALFIVVRAGNPGLSESGFLSFDPPILIPLPNYSYPVPSTFRRVLTDPAVITTSSHEIKWWKSWLFETGVRLLDANEDGSYPVMMKVELGSEVLYYPLCEDQFNDRTANTICNMYTYERGYRTSYTIGNDVKFLNTALSCYKKTDGYVLSSGTYVVSMSDCSLDPYTEESLPCARGQAAAVHCYDTYRTETYQPHSFFVQTTDRKYTLSFGLDLFKNGRKFPVFGSKGIKDHPLPEDFIAEACGEQHTPHLVVSSSKQLFQLSGKFRRKCSSCTEFFYYGQYFKTVCRGDVY